MLVNLPGQLQPKNARTIRYYFYVHGQKVKCKITRTPTGIIKDTYKPTWHLSVNYDK